MTIGCLMFIAWAVGVEIILAVLFCVGLVAV